MYQDVEVDQKFLLKPFLNEDATINFPKFRLYVFEILNKRPFFNRFDSKSIEMFLGNAKVKYFEQGDIYFNEGKVGVIKEGNMHVLTHKLNYLSPSTIAKLESGAVLGHSSDEGLTTDSENWIINYSKGTEVVMFDMETFERMWRHMSLNSQQQRLIHYLSYCPLLSCLSYQTLSSLVYDS